MIIRTNTTEESLYPLTHSTPPYTSPHNAGMGQKSKILVIMLSTGKYTSDYTQVN